MRLQNTTSCTGKYYAISKHNFRSFSCSVFYAHQPPKMCKSAKMCSWDPSSSDAGGGLWKSKQWEHGCDDVPSAAKVKLTQQGGQKDDPPSRVLFISISSGFSHYILGTRPVCLKSGSSLLKAAGALAAFVGWLHLCWKSYRGPSAAAFMQFPVLYQLKWPLGWFVVMLNRLQRSINDIFHIFNHLSVAIVWFLEERNP